MDQVLEEVLPANQDFALLGGAMIAEEIHEDLIGAGILAANKQETLTTVSELFNQTKLLLETTLDLHGVALCGVLKNVYAIGLGICDGLGLGKNTKG